MDQEETCVNFTIERWFPVANMSRYLPIRVYDYYAPGNTSSYTENYLIELMKKSISERFNETIFDALPTYLLNICEVCGSSQCPYCSIYNKGSPLKANGLLIVFIMAYFWYRKYSLNEEINIADILQIGKLI